MTNQDPKQHKYQKQAAAALWAADWMLHGSPEGPERYEHVVRLLLQSGDTLPQFIDTCIDAMTTPFDD